MRYRQIGFAGPCRTKGKNHVVASERFHIMGLANRPRKDRLLAGPDHHLGRFGDIILAGFDHRSRFLHRFRDPRIGGHGDDCFDGSSINFLSLFQAVIDARQDGVCL